MTFNTKGVPDYQLIEDMEPITGYRPGGYHPVQIGDHLRDRYQIVHKLGFGTYSTIWLARDPECATYVAVKIAIAETEHPPETDILRLLEHHNAHPEKGIIPTILDEFKIQGPNGSHQCLVTATARMSVAEAREASYKRIFQLPVARAIAAQLIQAIAFLHSQGLIHSDLHEGNILLRLPKSINNLTPDQLYDSYGQPELEPVYRVDGKPLDKGVPAHGIVPIWFGAASEDVTLTESIITLSDFGESFQPAVTPRWYSNTPHVLRAPELYLDSSKPISFAADIWALACTIFAILGQRHLFDTWFPTADEIVKEQVDTLGRLPPDWWALWANRSDSFNEELERTNGQPRRPWATRFEYSIQEPRTKFGMTKIEADEKAALETLLLSMLTFKPEDRPSAQQVMDSEWMTKWALPDLDKARGSFSEQI